MGALATNIPNYKHSVLHVTFANAHSRRKFLTRLK